MTAGIVHIAALLRKDILLEIRQQYTFYGILLYVASTIFVLYLAMGQPESAVWNGLFWMIQLFICVNAVAKSFLQLVGIAIVIAIPLAWWAGNKWLQDFAFRIQVQASVFIVTAIITALIAFCTVGYHTIRTALTNPVKSLRTE